MPKVVIPGLAEARAAERLSREAAFLSETENVAGVELRALTARDTLVLEAAGSPFVVGGPAEDWQVAQFLWAQSVCYQPCPQARKRFLKSIRLQLADLAGTSAAIRCYCAEAMLDSPGSSGGSGGSAPATSWVASLVDAFGSEYGWTPATSLNEPLRRAWQYLRRIQKRLNPAAVMFNPSDRVIANWLEEQNAKNARQ